LVPGNFNYPKDDIVTTAVSVAALSTLVTAIKTGNLVQALSYPRGPFTVFAPTNDAFAKLPAGVLAYLLAHPQELDAVLTYHVVDARGDRGRGRLYADEIHNFQEAFTLNGQPLVFVVAGGKVLVNGNSTVIQANVDTSNGVVHVVDTVLIPNAQVTELAAKAAKWNAKNLRQVAAPLPNLLQLAQSVPQLSTLVAAVTAAGLGSVLAGPGPLTVFAPSNQAFAKLPADFLNYLLQPANKAALVDIITYHVVPGNYSSGDLHDHEDIKTAEGQNVTIFKDQRGQIFVNFARVIAPNNEASNGVAHIIDEVLLPRTPPTF
jgi:transforming growth factor-beta-induced protein